MKLLQRWKQTALHNKALVFTSLLVAFGTLFYAGAAVVQVYIMEAAAKATGEQTQKLITQAEKNAAAAQSFAASADKIDNAIRNANAIAMRAIDVGNRPWMGVKSLKIDLQVGKPTRTNVNFTNFGKSPAEHFVIHMGYDLDKGCPSANFKYTIGRTKGGPLHPEKEATSESTVMPGESTHNLESVDEHTVPDAQAMFLLNTHKTHLYFYGEADYSDWHGGKHHTHFCTIYAPNAPPQVAQEYNDAN